jgi:hypothetical protein
MPKYSEEDVERGKGCLHWLTVGCLSMIAIPFVLLAGVSLTIGIFEGIGFNKPTPSASLKSTITNSPSVSTSTPSSSPLKDTNSSITYYLAVNADVPAPENPVPVADYETMQALVSAAESKDEAKYNSLLQSPSVSLVYGGGIVFIQDRKDGLVKVEIMGKSVNGDISGQTRWTSDRFIQSREF